MPIIRGVLINIYQLALQKKKEKKALICGGCQFLWHTLSHDSQFQATTISVSECRVESFAELRQGLG